MKGLIIKEEWIDKILYNNKTLEIRNCDTKNINMDIYILESNTQKIRAIAKIKKTIKLNKKIWEEEKNNHQVDITFDKLLTKYKTPYAWEIKIVKIIDKELYYEHKNGCIIWVNNIPEYDSLIADLLDYYDF